MSQTKIPPGKYVATDAGGNELVRVEDIDWCNIWCNIWPLYPTNTPATGDYDRFRTRPTTKPKKDTKQ